MKSMTGYASATAGPFLIEIHSVNRKGLDLGIGLPRELLAYDVEIRKWLGEELARGQVTVRVSHAEGVKGAPDLSRLKKLKQGWEKVAESLGYQKKDIALSFLINQLVDIREEPKGTRQFLQAGVKKALHLLTAMKKREGAALLVDIVKRVKMLEARVKQLEGKAGKTVSKYREKLRERILEATGLDMKGDERMFKEVALFAEKVDVTEELTRLRSHFKQFYALLKSDEKSIGRTLDFLTQEINREINTLGSKALDAEISAVVVEMKSELEKIREQVQNIE
jgi:uncharacterized protein (TIGR00255 family)